MLVKRALTVVLLLFLFLLPHTPQIGIRYNGLGNIVFLEFMVMFGCTQLIPLSCEQTPGNIVRGPLQRFVSRVFTRFYCSGSKTVLSDSHFEAFIQGILKLILRFIYFTLLAAGVANVWGRY